MGAFQLAIDIRRPRADVFAFIAEPQNMPLWYEAVQQVTKRQRARRASARGTRSCDPCQTPLHITTSKSSSTHRTTSYNRKPLGPYSISLPLPRRTERARHDTHPRLQHHQRRPSRTCRPSRRHRNPTVQTRHEAEPAPAQADPRNREQRRSMTGPAQTDLEQTERAHEPAHRTTPPSEQRGRT